MNPEQSAKLQRLQTFFAANNLQCALLSTRANFAWATCGHDNHIANNSPVGVASILVDGEKCICLCDEIEAPRFQTEELVDTGIEVVSYPWYDTGASKKLASKLIAGRSCAIDVDRMNTGLQPLPAKFDELRWSLTPEEVERYKEAGKRISKAVEAAARALKPGMNEHEIAGILDHEVHSAGLNPVVTLIALDDRIRNYRHPIATNTELKKMAMLVSCGEYAGLICSLTRFVHFGELPDDLKKRHQAVCNVDAAINLSTAPGKSLGELFEVVVYAYAREGFDGEWKLHHQGGSTGYNGRDVFANPTSRSVVVPNQAFAWNPSITGTKSEDTFLCTDSGMEPITAPTADWPSVIGQSPMGELRRADIVVV